MNNFYKSSLSKKSKIKRSKKMRSGITSESFKESKQRDEKEQLLIHNNMIQYAINKIGNRHRIERATNIIIER